MSSAIPVIGGRSHPVSGDPLAKPTAIAGLDAADQTAEWRRFDRLASDHAGGLGCRMDRDPWRRTAQGHQHAAPRSRRRVQRAGPAVWRSQGIDAPSPAQFRHGPRQSRDADPPPITGHQGDTRRPAGSRMAARRMSSTFWTMRYCIAAGPIARCRRWLGSSPARTGRVHASLGSERHAPLRDLYS